MIPVALAEDDLMLRTVIVHLIESLGPCKIVLQSSSGPELLMMLNPSNLPELVLMDVNRQYKDGMTSARLISEKYPQIKMIAMVTEESELSVEGLIINRVRGYTQTDAGPNRLRESIANVLRKTFIFPTS
jgi:DNA-binding NarL/FixJ family response regulator